MAIDASRIGNFFSALANELRVLGVTTVYSLEVPDILGPAQRVPVDDASSLAENMIWLRFVEQRAHVHRLTSVLKVRDRDFEPALPEFILTILGMAIHATPASAETILASAADRAANKNSLPAAARQTSNPASAEADMAVVLVVDDEWGIANFLEEVLTDEGHEVIVAHNGRQALERAAELRPALVLTDYMMPVMDGADFIDAMAKDPALADVPVMVMSSMLEDTVAER